MSEPAVSILIATCNRPESLNLALATIGVQQFQNWEALVIHDGECRGTSELVGGYQARDRRIRYFHRDERMGIAAAMNFGLKNARGRYVAVLDDDDLWIDTEKLRLQTEFLDSNCECVACGGGAIVIDGSGHETMRHLKPQHDEAIRRVALVANPLIHSSIMYRRDRALGAGGYDADLKGFHDWDLWLRLGRAGKFFNFQRYFAGYRVWGGSGSSQSARDNARSAVRIVMRHRDHYSGFPQGLAMAWGYRAFAVLPRQLKSSSFALLSRLKKKVFSSSQPRSETRWSQNDLDRLINAGLISGDREPNGFPRGIEPSSALIRGL